MIVIVLTSIFVYFFANIFKLFLPKKSNKIGLSIPKLSDYKNYYLFKSDLKKYNDDAYEEYLNELCKRDLNYIKKEDLNFECKEVKGNIKI